MKIKNFKFIAGSLSALAFIACSEDEPTVEYVTNTVTETVVETVEVEVEAPTYVIDSDITEDTTLDASVVWTLDGRVFVKDGVTLTIPAGTIIKATGGTGTNASVLVVAQGGKIEAAGTAHESVRSLCASFGFLVFISMDLSDFIRVGMGFMASLNIKG